MASVVFGQAIKKINDGTMDWDTLTTVRAYLTKSSFNTTLNASAIDNFDFGNDIPTADRLGSSKVIGSRTVTQSATANKWFFDGQATITFPTISNGKVAGGIVIYKSSGATTTASPLFCYCQFSANVTADGGTVTVNRPTNGYFQCSY